MTKVIVYASMTGNTEAMAQAVAEGARTSGAEVLVCKAEEASSAVVLASDVIFLGSPAMGSEVLEDSMEAFFSSIELHLAGKKIALFGSYDWGDKQFLRDWADRVKKSGGRMMNGEGLAVHLTPEEVDVAACRELGATVA
jgi:flavodoxin I